jgi:hypothetical protein
MEVTKLIKWSQEDKHYLKQLDKWLTLTDRIELTEDEMKSATLFLRVVQKKLTKRCRKYLFVFDTEIPQILWTLWVEVFLDIFYIMEY